MTHTRKGKGQSSWTHRIIASLACPWSVRRQPHTKQSESEENERCGHHFNKTRGPKPILLVRGQRLHLPLFPHVPLDPAGSPLYSTYIVRPREKDKWRRK